MANPSIFAAFERMWQHIVAVLGRKADADAIPTIDDTISDTSTNPIQNKVIKTYVDTKVAGIVDTAPETLNTLNELSAALGDDPNFATTVATQIGGKVDKVSGKGLSTNDYTTTEKNKLAGIATGAEVNQNAFSNITVGSTTIAADAKSDTLTLVAGTNITLTPDATNDKITIAATGGSGTITGVSANGTSVATSGVANIPAASTSKYGVTKLSSSTSSTSTSLAATASAVKSAYDLANTANTAASTAKTTADTASSTASAAQTTANAAMPKSGGTFTGAATAQNNTSYTTKQIRNIYLIAEGETVPSGANGDICLVYVP